VILPIVLVLQKTFEHGYGGLILVPIFGLIALLPFGYAWQRAKSLGSLGTLVVRCACLIVFAYLCKKVYVGTLPASEFPSVRPGQLRGDEAAAIVGWGGLIFLSIIAFLMAWREGANERKNRDAQGVHIGH
jgi:hypothetical protein